MSHLCKCQYGLFTKSVLFLLGKPSRDYLLLDLIASFPLSALESAEGARVCAFPFHHERKIIKPLYRRRLLSFSLVFHPTLFPAVSKKIRADWCKQTRNDIIE